MTTTHFTQQPTPVLVQHLRGHIHVSLALHARQINSDSTPDWEADCHQFWEQEGVLDLADLQAQPEAYLHYIPRATRQAAKDQAQVMLDALRAAGPVVPVPSYRKGAVVCNRPADQVKLLAGLSMGSLPYYELASGEVVNLTAEDIKAIAVDVAAAETAWQQAKQACWQTIDTAEAEEDITTALANFSTLLNNGTPGTTSVLLSSTSPATPASWQQSLLTGWGLKESWPKIMAGSLAGALAAMGLLTGCSPLPGYAACLPPADPTYVPIEEPWQA